MFPNDEQAFAYFTRCTALRRRLITSGKGIFSFEQLIVQAIISSATGMVPLSTMLFFVMENYPQYRSADSVWMADLTAVLLSPTSQFLQVGKREQSREAWWSVLEPTDPYWLDFAFTNVQLNSASPVHQPISRHPPRLFRALQIAAESALRSNWAGMSQDQRYPYVVDAYAEYLMEEVDFFAAINSRHSYSTTTSTISSAVSFIPSDTVTVLSPRPSSVVSACASATGPQPAAGPQPLDLSLLESVDGFSRIAGGC